MHGKESNLITGFVDRGSSVELPVRAVKVSSPTSPLSRECSSSELTARNCLNHLHARLIRTSNLAVWARVGPLSYRRSLFFLFTSSPDLRSSAFIRGSSARNLPVGHRGLEPRTFRMSYGRSSQLTKAQRENHAKSLPSPGVKQAKTFPAGIAPAG